MIKKDCGKKAKIIVRNLPFKNLSDESFRALFHEYGEITEAVLLKKNGKYVGCGFIQFSLAQSAAKAIHHVNGKEIYGRKIIVDRALPKNVFIEKLKQYENQSHNAQVVKENDDVDHKVKEEDKIDDDSDEEEGKNNYNEGEDEDEDEDDEDEDDEDDEDDEEEDKEEYGAGDNVSEFTRSGKKEKNSSRETNEEKTLSNDVEEGKTVFIKNIPFSATEDDLKKCFEPYGPILYALICVDKLTEHSKGTAFVKFKEKESTDKCLKDSKNIILEDQALEINIALSKENLTNKKQKKTVKDSRNLYLVREGLVMARSKAAEGVSASDMAKRLQIEQWKTQILKNLHMFVAKTRICIHNLPSSYDDAKLKAMVLKYGNPKAIIREARVMRDFKNYDSNGMGTSKEIGFVSFSTHDDALTALRNINNNPNIFTPKKRPIVAFSIENRAIINLKQKRIERSRAKLGISEDKKTSKLNSKQRRFIKRRQKIIKKRKEGKKPETVRNEGENVTGKLGKRKAVEKNKVPKKKQKSTLEPKHPTNHSSSSDFAGVAAEPGKVMKFRSGYKLKRQANIHKDNLKKQRRQKRERDMKKVTSEKIKQPKQKQGKQNLSNDSHFTKLISDYKKKITSASSFKKWYEG